MITNQEIIIAAEKLARQADSNFFMDYQNQDISQENFNSIFVSKSPSQIEIDGEAKSDYPLPVTYSDVYNEVIRNKRKVAYGTWEDQMEMQFDGTWEDHVNSVKEQFPFI